MSKNNVQELESLRSKLKEKRVNKKNVEIGDFTYGNPKVLSWGEGTKLEIGKFCSIADDVIILLGGEHRIDWITTYPFNVLLKSYDHIKGHPKSKGDVKIGNDVWIGTGSVILSGVTIGDGAVIGAYSLITRDVEPYSIVGGNPGKHIKYRFNKNIINKLLEIKWWDKELDEIAEMVPLLQSQNMPKFIKTYSVTNNNLLNALKNLFKK